MEILLVVLLSLVLLLLLILIVLMLKRKTSNTGKEAFDLLERINQSNSQSIREINERLSSNQEKMLMENAAFRESMKDSMNQMKEVQTKNQSQVQKEMNDFRITMNDRIDKYMDQSEKAITESYSKLLELVTTQLNEMRNNMNENLKTGFETNSKSMNEVNLALGKITAAQSNLDSLKEQVVSLNNVLTNSQQRGRFGEVCLESILQEVYGDTRNLYDTQHVLKNKTRPDAVIYLPGDKRYICIDSKFSFVDYSRLFETKDVAEKVTLEKKFKSALRDQIKKISTDYVSQEDTSQYAIMFIPSDGIYTFLQSNEEFYKDVVSYARGLSVILTSPSTLQPILANIRILHVNYEVSNNIKGIIEQISKLKKENDRFYQDWESFSKSMQSMDNKREAFDKRVLSFSNKARKVLEEAKDKDLIEEENVEDQA